MNDVNGALVDERHLRLVAGGAYQLELFSSEDVGHARRVMERGKRLIDDVASRGYN